MIKVLKDYFALIVNKPFNRQEGECKMGNMSYCRFQNTLLDLQDCMYALEEMPTLGGLSHEEMSAAKALIEMCGYLHADFEDFE